MPIKPVIAIIDDVSYRNNRDLSWGCKKNQLVIISWKAKLDRQDGTQKIQKHNLSVAIFIHTDRYLLFFNTLLCILSNRRGCFLLVSPLCYGLVVIVITINNNNCYIRTSTYQDIYTLWCSFIFLATWQISHAHIQTYTRNTHIKLPIKTIDFLHHFLIFLYYFFYSFPLHLWPWNLL